MSNLNVRIGAHALFGTNISHRRARGPRVLRGLSLLLGLLVGYTLSLHDALPI